MKAPRVSVVMAVYNDAPYIRGAVGSILAQTFRDFEFIIINDGSTDGTAECLASYQDERLQIIHQENRGLTQSLNRGLALARGEYIARMDGDDISHRERFAREVDYLDAHPNVGLVGTFTQRIDEFGKIIGPYTYKITPSEIRENLWVDCPFCHSSIMYRRVSVECIGRYREKVGPSEDYDLYFRLSEYCDLANIPIPLHCFRIDPRGITVQKRFEQLRYMLLVRRLAELRRQKGIDPLDQWSDREIAAVLEELLPRTPENEERVRRDNCLYLADIAYMTGNYRRSWSWLYKAGKQGIFNKRGLLLSLKLWASMLTPTPVKQYIKNRRS